MTARIRRTTEVMTNAHLSPTTRETALLQKESLLRESTTTRCFVARSVAADSPFEFSASVGTHQTLILCHLVFTPPIETQQGPPGLASGTSQRKRRRDSRNVPEPRVPLSPKEVTFAEITTVAEDGKIVRAPVAAFASFGGTSSGYTMPAHLTSGLRIRVEVDGVTQLRVCGRGTVTWCGVLHERPVEPEDRRREALLRQTIVRTGLVNLVRRELVRLTGAIDTDNWVLIDTDTL